MVMSAPTWLVGTVAVDVERGRTIATERRAREHRVAVAARTLGERLEAARRGARDLCDADPAFSAASVSPSGDVERDRARARIHGMRERGLDLVDVLSPHGELLASSHAHGRAPFVEMPNADDLAHGAFVHLTEPHDRLPRHAVVVGCRASGDLVVAGVGLELERDPRFADVDLVAAVDPDDVALPTELVGARFVRARPLAPTEGWDATALVRFSSGTLFALGLLLGLRLERDAGSRGPTADESMARELREAAAKISRGDFDVQLRFGDEATAAAFERMTRELAQARARAVKAERIAAWRDIARRIAHEIKNPLTPIRMAIETMRKTFARNHPDFPEIFEESTRAVLEEVARLERIVTEFSRFARLPRPDPTLIDPLDVAVHVVSLHETKDAAATNPSVAKGPQLTLDVAPELAEDRERRLVRADREQITQVLLNLVRNALDAALETHPSNEAHVVVRLAPGEHGGVVLEVHDDGPGVPVEDRARIFEPYFTTKEHGTGLGLPICDRIVSDHGGSILVDESPLLGGARFVVTLPREGPPEEANASQTS